MRRGGRESKYNEGRREKTNGGKRKERRKE